MKLDLRFVPFLFISIESSAQFQFLSPIPGASLISPSHNIIIREGNEVKVSSLHKNLFSIEGEKSGRHEFELKLLTDQKTVLLETVSPFDFNEQVTVTIHRGFETASGELPTDFSFSFNTHRQYNHEERQRMNEQRESRWIKQLMGTAREPGTSLGDIRSPLEGSFELTVNKSPSPGEIFFDSWNASPAWKSEYDGYHIITTDGDSVFSNPGQLNRIFEWDLNPNGYLAWWNKESSTYEVLDSNYQVVDRFMAANGYYADPHEFTMYADGRVILLAQESHIVDMTVYDPDYDDSCLVTSTIIQEFDHDKNLVFEWRSLDHIAFEESNQVLWYEFLDYVHTNSVEIDFDGHFLVSHRHLDEVSKIDRNTGEFIWRLGGKMNQFTFINDDERFNFQHDARRIANGNVTLWDNGVRHPAPHSTAKEYELDEEHLTATLVWSYAPIDPVTGAQVHFPGMGNVQRLENGNTFINGGWDYSETQPNMWEVTPAGKVVWELTLNNEAQLVCYRAHKRSWRPCAPIEISAAGIRNITSRTAEFYWTPVSNSSYYEIRYRSLNEEPWIAASTTNSSILLNAFQPESSYEYQLRNHCSNGHPSDWTPADSFTTSVTSLFPLENLLQAELNPNLTNDAVVISWQFTVVDTLQIKIYDQAGRLITSSQHQTGLDSKSFLLDVSFLPAGMYFTELISSASRAVARFVKM